MACEESLFFLLILISLEQKLYFQALDNAFLRSCCICLLTFCFYSKREPLMEILLENVVFYLCSYSIQIFKILNFNPKQNGRIDISLQIYAIYLEQQNDSLFLIFLNKILKIRVLSLFVFPFSLLCI